MTEKEILRAKIIEKRKLISKEKFEEAGRLIATQFLKKTPALKDLAVMIYISKDNEISTKPLMEALLKTGCILLAPVVKGNEMEARRLYSEADLEAGSFGILEPKALCEPFEKSKIDICLVPGLCFDEKGYRIGFGRGFYDRFLENFSKETIGLAMEELLIPALPREPHDVPVHKLITEKRTINVAK